MAKDGSAHIDQGNMSADQRSVKQSTDATPLQWHSAALSELGYVRSVNEDALLDSREQFLWVVADGMGGHSFGDEASQTIVDQLTGFHRGDNMAENIADIEKRLIQANTFCRRKSQGQVMGSTVVALFVHEPYCFFLWAGDSRIYRLRNSNLEQMTEDHSYVQELVTLGEIRREDMERHPSSNIITRAIGVHDELQLENQHTLIEPGDRFLVCSDGLFKDISHDEIARGMSLSTVEEAVKNLVDLSLERGGRDNTTAIVVQAENP